MYDALAFRDLPLRRRSPSAMGGDALGFFGCLAGAFLVFTAAVGLLGFGSFAC
jgi:hypothetical protein